MSAIHSCFRAVQVGLEVIEVGVGEDVFFTGDLRGCNLVQQALGAGGNLRKSLMYLARLLTRLRRLPQRPYGQPG